MDHGPYYRDDYDLNTVLRELDTAKALLRKKQLELNNAIPVRSQSDCSPNALRTFEAVGRGMKELAERYFDAVAAFNRACQTGPHRPQASAVASMAKVRWVIKTFYLELKTHGVAHYRLR